MAAPLHRVDGVTVQRWPSGWPGPLDFQLNHAGSSSGPTAGVTVPDISIDGVASPLFQGLQFHPRPVFGTCPPFHFETWFLRWEELGVGFSLHLGLQLPRL